MAVKEDVVNLVRAFYNHEIDDFSLYLEGFGGLFVSRTKDGMVIGYVDKNKRFGADDHVTVFFDEHGLKSLHRKVTDPETDVYMKYNVNYFQTSHGIKRLVQDMQKSSDTPLYMKVLLIVLYRVVGMAFQRAPADYRRAEVLKDSEAQRLGVKPPCIYVKLGPIERFFLPVYDKALLLQNLVHRFKFGERHSEGFTEQHFPGSHITKRPKK